MSGRYSDPTKKCDMVMKGGITSGVVYPLAISELAKTYTFRNLGGTSAGAIAAAGAAAAEYGRQNRPAENDESGFELLEKLPDWLGGNLFSLFQPQADTKKIFNILIAGLSGDNKGGAVLMKALWASLSNFPFPAFLGILPGLILAVLTIQSASGMLLVWSLVSAILLILAGFAFAIVIAAVSLATKTIPRNFYGLCSGMSFPSEAALTPWLTNFLDQLAGIKGRDKPLTFGDLWGDAYLADNTLERTINLEMLTTNVTTGGSHRLPFDTDQFFFDPKEFEQLFPKNVVDWMKANPAEIDPSDDPSQGTPYLPMPAAKDLPVVVATRLSLSFPILLSAIPFYAVDKTRIKQKPILERCWFSDGGIVSNMPVHFFDKPLSRWPTFAIDLQNTQPDQELNSKDQSKNIWTPTRNIGGIGPAWSRIDAPDRSGSIPAFLGLIFNTMQNWRDNAQMRVPGYRDRVVHILMNPEKEGGLKLKMSPDEINVLSERGKFAGLELVKRFASSEPVQRPEGVSPIGWIEHPWENHRWIRFRSVMSLLEGFLKDFARTYKNPEPGDKPYAQLIQNPISYKWERSKQEAFAAQTTQELLALIEKWEQNDQTFTEDAPKPTPVLRVSPKI